MDTRSVLSRPCALGKMNTVGGCRMRPEGPKIEAEIEVGFLGARGYGSDVNKTKFLRPRPK